MVPWSSVRVRGALWASVGLALALPHVAQAQRRPDRAQRYVSSQAYYHSMRAELAEAKGDVEKMADELQLALVYDADSSYLTLRLARVQLELGRLRKARRHADRAVTLDPNNAEAWRVVAKVAIADGAERRAVRALERAVRRDRQALGAWLDLARVHRAAGRDKRALSVLDRAARQIPQSAAPLAAAAAIHTERGKLRPAIRFLERALAREPRRADLLARLSMLDERRLEPERAVQRWRTFLRRYPTEVDALLHLAQNELIVGNVPAAVRAIERLEAQGPRPDLPRVAGFLFFAEGAYREAIVQLEKAATTLPPEPRVRFALGLARHRLGEDDAALADLERIRTEGTEDLYVRARVHVAEILMSKGRHDRAELSVRGALEKRPDSPVLRALLARVLARRGRVDEALAGLKEGPAHPLVIEREAELLLRYVGADEALARIDEVRETDGVDNRALDFALADVAHAAGRHKRTRKALERLLASDPNDPRALALEAHVLVSRRENLPEAQRLVREALQRDPKAPSALDTYGWVLFQRRRATKALPFLERAHRLAPRDPVIAEHVADVRQALGDTEHARAAYEIAKRGFEALVRARAPSHEADVDRVARKLTLEGRR